MTRDMTDAQFKAALKRNGFRRILLWAETEAVPGVSFSLLFHPRTRKVLKRQSVAYLIKRRDEEIAKRKAETGR